MQPVPIAVPLHIGDLKPAAHRLGGNRFDIAPAQDCFTQSPDRRPADQETVVGGIAAGRSRR